MLFREVMPVSRANHVKVLPLCGENEKGSNHVAGGTEYA
jgi:hypothetical protein